MTEDYHKNLSSSLSAGLPNKTRTAMQGTARKSSLGSSLHCTQASREMEKSQKMLTARKSSKAAPNSSLLSLHMLRPSIINTVHTKLAASTSQKAPILLKPVRISHEEPVKSVLGMTTALPVSLKLPVKLLTSNNDAVQPVVAVKTPQNNDQSKLGAEKELRVVLPKLNQFNDGATRSECQDAHKTNVSYTAASRVSCHELRRVRVKVSNLRLVRLKDSDEKMPPTSAEVAAKAIHDYSNPSSGSVAQLLSFRMPSSMQLASSQHFARSIPLPSMESSPSHVTVSKMLDSGAGCNKFHAPKAKIISTSVESMEDTSVHIANQPPKINALPLPEESVTVVLPRKMVVRSCFHSTAHLKLVHVQIIRLQPLTMTASFCKQHGLSKQCCIKLRAELRKLTALKRKKSSIVPSGSIQRPSISSDSPARAKKKSFKSKWSKSAKSVTKYKNSDDPNNQNVGKSAKTDTKSENEDEMTCHVVLTTPKMNKSNLYQSKTLSSCKKRNTQKWHWNAKKIKLELHKKRPEAFVRKGPTTKTKVLLTVQRGTAKSAYTKTVPAGNKVSNVSNEAGSASKNLTQASASPTVKKAGPVSKHNTFKVASLAKKSSHCSPSRMHSVEYYAATSERAATILKAKRVSFCDEVDLCSSSTGESETGKTPHSNCSCDEVDLCSSSTGESETDISSFSYDLNEICFPAILVNKL